MKTSNKRLYESYIKYKGCEYRNKWAFKFLGETVSLIDENSEIKQFVDAILDGEEIELEEQMYYVKLPYLNEDRRYFNKDRLDDELFFTDSHGEIDFKTQFTEQEIKEKWPKFWQFAVKVEDDND